MAALNLNKVILVGRLTADPELKTTQGGVSVTSFTVAVNRPYSKDGQQTADFISVVAWRQSAEFITKHFHKGNSICLMGSIQTRSYDDQNGVKRYVVEVVCDEARFVDSKADSAPTNGNAVGYMPEAYTGGGSFEEVSVNDDDDGLPF